DKPELAQKLVQFADNQITALYGVWPEGKDIPKMLTVWYATGREDLKPYLKQAVDDLYNDIAHNLTTASSFANHIRYMTIAFQIFQEDKYIKKAEEFVRAALLKMFDDYSPLPRINTADTLYSGNGTGYINFYHAPGGSDDLMWALALYAREAGWILEDNKPVAHAGSNQMVNAGDTVFLDGSASYSPQGGSVNYTWKVPGEITLNDSTIVNPTFLAPHVESIRTFDVGLVVNDGVLVSDADIVYIIVSPSVGINTESGKEISVFPNPCVDYITIDLGTNSQQSIKLDVLAMSGRLIDTFDIHSKNTTLEIHQIPPGVYTLMFHFNNYTLIKKIVKMD
ncbi:MAG: T9SS type A sorting domain-containing protein, partial [Bacteroidales bacterium]|nr:T9SS type A sorting domain-containing protein [Bacteroidales bacterium]